jgi:hypothetical protein
MFSWTDDEPMPCPFDHKKGKVIFWVKTAGIEEVSVVNGAVSLVRKAQTDLGRDPNDAACVGEQKKTESLGYASYVERLELPGAEAIAEKEQIAGRMRKLPWMLYQRLISAIIGETELTPLEGKV